MNILIIDDDVYLTAHIVEVCTSHAISNRIDVIHSLADFAQMIHTISSYDIIITDLEFPDDSGYLGWYSLIELIRRYNTRSPLIVMSGHGDLDILRRAFELWANDYLIKPIRLKELELRIVNWFKQSQFPTLSIGNTSHDIGGLVFDFDRNEFYKNGTKIILTRMNKYLLFLFFSHAHQILRDDYLREKIWWDRVSLVERNIRIIILRLRKSLQEYGIDTWIETSRWEGYIFEPR